MGDNGHLQPLSRFPGCKMAGELKILVTNLKSQEIINFYLIFYRFYCVVEQSCHALLSFYLFPVSGIRLGKDSLPTNHPSFNIFILLANQMVGQ